MPELLATLEASRERRYEEQKFLAALQGVDLEDDGKKVEEPKVDKLAELRTKVLTGGKASDPNDVLSLVGKNAQAKGFGIGQGLAYAENDGSEWWLNG